MDQPRERRPQDDTETAPERVSKPAPEPLPDDEPDFADEHTSVTFADQLKGGPEGMTESEAPEGYAGMDEE